MPNPVVTRGNVCLELRGLRPTDIAAHAVSLSLRAGEILCLAGLIGAGRSELAQTSLESMVRGEERFCWMARW